MTWHNRHVLPHRSRRDFLRLAGGGFGAVALSVLAAGPSLGSWALYGLGTLNRNLPGFVVMADGTADVAGGARNWGAGYMPASYQGTPFRAGESPVLNLSTPKDVGGDRQRDKLGLIGKLNEIHR